jgi:hypothetical protein
MVVLIRFCLSVPCVGGTRSECAGKKYIVLYCLTEVEMSVVETVEQVRHVSFAWSGEGDSGETC